MNKKELIKAVAEKVNTSPRIASDVVDAVLDTIIDAVANGEKVQLVGFGSFEARDRAAKISRNPATGEQIEVPACKAPAFKSGKFFKNAVNK